MKLSGTSKQKILAVVFALVAGAVFWVAINDNNSRDDVMKVLRASRDISANTKIEKTDFAVIDVGSYNLPKDVISDADAEKLIGKYAAHTIFKGRDIHISDVLKEKAPDKAFLYQPGKIIVAFDTDLSRSVGGLPSEGSLITLDGFVKDPNGGVGRTELMPGPPVAVCMVMNSSADEAKKDTGGMSGGTAAKPAAIIVEVDSLDQASWINRMNNEGKIYCYLHTREDKMSENKKPQSATVPPPIKAPAQNESAPVSEATPPPNKQGGFVAQ